MPDSFFLVQCGDDPGMSTDEVSKEDHSEGFCRTEFFWGSGPQLGSGRFGDEHLHNTTVRSFLKSKVGCLLGFDPQPYSCCFYCC